MKVCCGTEAVDLPPVTIQQPVPCVIDNTERYTLKLYFRHFAWAYTAAFFGTLFIAGIVTFTATEYSPEVDKITLFYGMFNPCILFDHYPAKVFATTGMGIFILIGIAYSAMLFVYVYCEKRLLKAMWSASLISVVILIDLVFVNVFTTNLYPMEDPSDQVLPDPSGLVRRLHGVHFGMNKTVSLVEEQELSTADVNIIKLHTIFYILWVVGQVLLAFHVYAIGTEGMDMWSGSSRAKTICLNVLGWYGMVMHAAAMLIIVMHPQPKVSWYFNEELSSILQHVVIYVDAKTFTSAWGWAPIMLFRLIMPAGRGISLTFRLENVQDDHGWVIPEVWMNRTVWGLASVLAWGGLFDPYWSDHSSAVKLMYSLRSKPYAYFGAPFFLCCVVLLALGLGLQVIQKRLVSRKMPMLFVAHAVALFASIFAVLLVILEKANWVSGIGWTTQVLFLSWVLHMNKDEIQAGRPYVAILYCLTGLAILVLAVKTTHWWLYFVYLAWLSMYGRAVPDGPKLYISAARIEEDGLSNYKAVPHGMAGPVP